MSTDKIEKLYNVLIISFYFVFNPQKKLYPLHIYRGNFLPAISFKGDKPMKSNCFIPLYFNLNSNPKFLRLCVVLNKTSDDERLLLRAKLENLWLWAMQYFPLGFLRSCSYQEIALACSWSENPETWVNALIECSWLESSDNGYKIVNWEHYGGKQAVKRHTDALRKRRYRNQDQPKEALHAQPGHIQSKDQLNNHVCLPEKTIITHSASIHESPRSPTIEKTARMSAGCHADIAIPVPNVFQHAKTIQSNELYDLYPRPGAKAASLKAIRRALDRLPYESLRQTLSDYIELNQNHSTNGSFPLAYEWFNRQCQT